MKQKKTLSELYEECKEKQEMEQQLGNLMAIAEMFKSQLATTPGLERFFNRTEHEDKRQ